jgi:hypothetical protein
MSEFDTDDGFDLDPQVVTSSGGASTQATPSLILVTRLTWIGVSILLSNACGSTQTSGRC